MTDPAIQQPGDSQRPTASEASRQTPAPLAAARKIIGEIINTSANESNWDGASGAVIGAAKQIVNDDASHAARTKYASQIATLVKQFERLIEALPDSPEVIANASSQDVLRLIRDTSFNDAVAVSLLIANTSTNGILAKLEQRLQNIVRVQSEQIIDALDGKVKALRDTTTPAPSGLSDTTGRIIDEFINIAEDHETLVRYPARLCAVIDYLPRTLRVDASSGTTLHGLIQNWTIKRKKDRHAINTAILILDGKPFSPLVSLAAAKMPSRQPTSKGVSHSTPEKLKGAGSPAVVVIKAVETQSPPPKTPDKIAPLAPAKGENSQQSGRFAAVFKMVGVIGRLFRWSSNGSKDETPVAKPTARGTGQFANSASLTDGLDLDHLEDGDSADARRQGQRNSSGNVSKDPNAPIPESLQRERNRAAKREEAMKGAEAVGIKRSRELPGVRRTNEKLAEIREKRTTGKGNKSNKR